jgi:hypothetical protein
MPIIPGFMTTGAGEGIALLSDSFATTWSEAGEVAGRGNRVEKGEEYVPGARVTVAKSASCLHALG